MLETQKIWPPSSAGLGTEKIKKTYRSDRNLADSIETRSIEEKLSDESDSCESSMEPLRPLTYGERVHLDLSITVTLKEDWKSEIRTEGKHLALPITLRTSEPESIIWIAVGLRPVSLPEDPLGDKPRMRRNPISGFPVVFKDLEATAMAQ